MSRIVFDIGGTSMRVAKKDGESVSGEQKNATPQSTTEAFSVLVESISSVSGEDKIESIVGGVAGAIDKKGTIITSPNLPEWNGYRLGANLEEHFKVPVIIENDANLAGLGEALYGAGKGFGIVAYMGIGTGVGGTRIVDGAIDKNAIGFEPGCQIIEARTHTTLEEAVGGFSLARKYKASPKDISRSVYEELTPLLSVGIWNMIVHWSPDIVVLGGSLINNKDAYLIEDIIRELEKIRVTLPNLPRISRAELNDMSGLYGAGALPINTPD